MQQIKKINPLSLGYNLALIYLVFGILFSIFLLILKNSSSFISSINPTVLTLTNSQVFLLYPLGYAIGGFITGYIIGFIYNHIVKITGGISIELTEGKKLNRNSDSRQETTHNSNHDSKPNSEEKRNERKKNNN
jgi:uncharacterized membrane protein YraQ (UPF0718 family)|tara:strand:+ start:465 stop:866 length:402 start_codon:yes stop_codon:yes gene_type:complete